MLCLKYENDILLKNGMSGYTAADLIWCTFTQYLDKIKRKQWSHHGVLVTNTRCYGKWSLLNGAWCFLIILNFIVHDDAYFFAHFNTTLDSKCPLWFGWMAHHVTGQHRHILFWNTHCCFCVIAQVYCNFLCCIGRGNWCLYMKVNWVIVGLDMACTSKKYMYKQRKYSLRKWNSSESCHVLTSSAVKCHISRGIHGHKCHYRAQI